MHLIGSYKTFKEENGKHNKERKKGRKGGGKQRGDDNR
jgi:hypothetical protein